MYAQRFLFSFLFFLITLLISLLGQMDQNYSSTFTLTEQGCTPGDQKGLISERPQQLFSTAKWIYMHGQERKISTPCPYFRTIFCIEGGEVASASVSASALGLYQIYINGQRVGEREEFSPGFSEYSKRAYYRSYDVLSLLRKGRNAIGGILGDGFYSGYVAFERKRNFYGFPPKFLVELEIVFTNGKIMKIGTDGFWKTSTGPILWSDIYDGEQYDARFELTEWDEAHYDDSKWVQAQEQDIQDVPIQLSLHPGPPIRKTLEIKPKLIKEVQSGVFVFDMGQNMVGWVRLNATGQPGNKLQIRFAEMLYDNGMVYTRNYRTARSTDEYIFSGEGEEIQVVEWEPHFTYHGFRYVELTGFELMKTKPDIDWVTGIVLHSDLPQTGEFQCSEPLLNQLQSNILWSQRGNFFDIPTDCPQRDERMGWTGDAQIFAPTAAFNMDVSHFFRKWITDLIDSQKPDGAVPPVAPNFLLGIANNSMDASAGWADAIIIIPYTMYLHYNDVQILKEAYPAMVKWVEYEVRTSKLLARPWIGFGDWLSVTPSPADMVGTAYFAYTTSLLAKIAKILGHEEHETHLEELHSKIKDAFTREFMNENNTDLAFQSQTVYLMALKFDLMPDRELARRTLMELIKEARFHLTTGFLGTPLLLDVLTEMGEIKTAYKLLLQKTHPSWLFPVTQGATTMWERWDSYSRQNGFGPSEMNSFNHYAYGAVGVWMYAHILGIQLDPDFPGYKRVIIAPKPGGGLQWAQGSLNTRYGQIQVSWQFVFTEEEILSQAFELKVLLDVGQLGLVDLTYFQTLLGSDYGVKVSVGETQSQTILPQTEIEIEGGKKQYTFQIEMKEVELERE